jgi:hypothetical protein
VRTTCYFGTDEKEAIAQFYQTKSEWQRVVAAEQREYEQERAWKLANNLPSPSRFKPCWPKEGRNHQSVRRWSDRINGLVEYFEEEKKDDAGNLSIREARERYLADCRGRIGLQGGKGINQNTYDKHAQNLTLALPPSFPPSSLKPNSLPSS